MYPGIWAQLTQHKRCQWGSKQIQARHSAVSIITLYVTNSELQKKKKKWKAELDPCDWWLWCWISLFHTSHFFACNPSFSVCMHQLGARRGEPGNKNQEDAPSILARYSDLHLCGRGRFMTCRKSSIFPPCFSTWLRIQYGRSNQECQRKVRLEGLRLIRALVYLIRNELE